MRISDWSSDVCSSDLLAASRAEGIRDALRSQAEHLTTASEQAETKARDLEALLATRTAELHAAVRDGVRAVGDTSEPAVDEARQIGETLRRQEQALTEYADTASDHSRTVADKCAKKRT